MIVLKIIGIALLIIVLLIARILACPVGIIIKNSENGWEFFGKILFINIPIETDKTTKKVETEKKTEKSKQGNKKQEKGFLDSILEALGISKLTNAKKDAEKNGFSDTVGDTVAVLTNIIKQVAALFKHIYLKKLYINCICGGEDAAEIAMDYGIACAVVYPLSGYVHSVMKVNSRKEKINVQCDFNREEGLFEVEALLSVRVIYILTAIVKLVKEESQRKLQEMK